MGAGTSGLLTLLSVQTFLRKPNTKWEDRSITRAADKRKLDSCEENISWLMAWRWLMTRYIRVKQFLCLIPLIDGPCYFHPYPPIMSLQHDSWRNSIHLSQHDPETGFASTLHTKNCIQIPPLLCFRPWIRKLCNTADGCRKRRDEKKLLWYLCGNIITTRNEPKDKAISVWCWVTALFLYSISHLCLKKRRLLPSD